MNINFDFDPLLGTYVTICRDIAKKFGKPIVSDAELASCFLEGFCCRMRNVLNEMAARQEKLDKKEKPYKREKQELEELPQYRMQMEYMLTQLERACRM